MYEFCLVDPRHQPSNQRKASVLVVDDSIFNLRHLQSLFDSLGYRVVGMAKDGQEAIDKYYECKPDLVTMDITMPEVDGISALRGILARFPEAKVIMITSNGMEEMVLKALRIGAKGYILKPVNVKALREQLVNMNFETDEKK
jgi:two-component system chemotaxis response regulator CheY